MRGLGFFGFLVLFVCSPVLAGADSFSLSQSSVDFSGADNSFDFLPPITLNNTINETINVKIEHVGDLQLVFAPRNVTIIPNNTLQLTLSSVIPVSILPGTYHNQFNLTYLNESKLLNVTVTVVDNIRPSLFGCTFSNNPINRTKQMSVNCQGVNDNIGVNSVYFLIQEQRVDLALNEGSYGGVFSIRDLGSYNSTVFVNDTSGNQVNYTMPLLDVVPFDPLSMSNVDFQHIKVGVEHSKVIANVREPANLSMRVDSFGFLENPNASIQLIMVLSDGSARSVTVGDLNALGVIPSGDVSVKVFSSEKGRFGGAVSFFFDEREYSANIAGEMADYTILPNTTFGWFGNQAWCAGIDAGVFENSSTVCSFQLPVISELNQTNLPAFGYSIYQGMGLDNFQQILIELQHLRESEFFWKIVAIIAISLLGIIEFYRWWDEREK